jgi:hypothetical protein
MSSSFFRNCLTSSSVRSWFPFESCRIGIFVLLILSPLAESVKMYCVSSTGNISFSPV